MVHAKAFLMSYQVSGQLHINIKEAGSGLWYREGQHIILSQR